MIGSCSVRGCIVSCPSVGDIAMSELRTSAAAVIVVLLVGIAILLTSDITPPDGVTDVLLVLAFTGTVILAMLLVR